MNCPRCKSENVSIKNYDDVNVCRDCCYAWGPPDRFGEHWFNHADFFRKTIILLPSGSRIVELGTHKGRSTNFFVKEMRRHGRRFSFDTFDRPDGLINRLFKENLSAEGTLSDVSNYRFMRAEDGAALYTDKSLDFVFLDASNKYEDHLNYIKLWMPKIKKGGIIGGHDFYCKTFGVERAVREYFGTDFVEEKPVWYHEVK
jgi:predicted O-methyltransferase YrrM